MPRALEALAWLGFFTCVRWVFGLFEYGQLEPSPLFNSDGLFLADLWRDLRAGGRLIDWQLPHATFLVPDLALWMFADLLTPTIPWAVLVFGVLQATLVAWVTRWLTVREFGPSAGALAPAAWALVFFLPSQHRAIEALDAFKPVHHFSIGIAGLAAVALFARALTPGRWATRLALAAFCFLLTVSDPFGVSAVWAPLLVLLGLVVLRDPVDRRPRLGLGVLLFGFGWAGNATSSWLTHAAGGMSTLKLEWAAKQWELLSASLATLRPEPVDGLAVLGVLSFVPLFVRGLRRLRTPDASALLDVLPLTAAVINEVLLFITGNIEPWEAVSHHFVLHRYVIVIFVYLVLTGVRLVATAARLRPRGLLAVSLVAALATVAAGVKMSQVSSQPKLFTFTEYLPPSSQCLDAIGAQFDLQRGLGEFWVARLTSLINHRGLKLEEVDASGAPRFWLTNGAGFRRTDVPFSFVVMTNLDPNWVANRFGPPSQQLQCPGTVVWWYAPDRRERILATINAMAPKEP
jgi:hypothetical protein